MDFAEYLSRIAEGFEFLIALGSLIGLLGVIFGFLMMLAGSHSKSTAIKLILFSAFLLGTTGMYTGIKYFRI